MMEFDNGINISIVTLQWTPPEYTGGVDINYVLTVSPRPVTSESTFTTLSSNTGITVSYNIQYNITIIAENCAGSSSGTMLMFEIGKIVYSSNFAYCYEPDRVSSVSYYSF